VSLRSAPHQDFACTTVIAVGPTTAGRALSQMDSPLPRDWYHPLNNTAIVATSSHRSSQL
jgi:hypothetical protein